MSRIRIFTAGEGSPRTLRPLWRELVRGHPAADFSDVLILTPHRAQIRNNRRVLLEETPVDALVPPRQVPLYDWLQGLLPDSLRVLTDEERFLLLVDLLMLPDLEQVRETLGIGERHVGLGLARHLFQALDDLRLWAFDRSEAELAATVDRTVDPYPHVAERIHALLGLLAAYRDRLRQAQAVDLPEALRLLLESFPEDRALAGLRFLVFQGLTMLDPLSREVLRQVITAARQRHVEVWALVPVTRTWPEPPFLQFLADFPGAEVQTVPRERVPELEGRAYLTRGDEVRAVVREIKQLLARSPEPLRIGITAPSLFEVLPALRQAFHEYGLDFVAYTGDPLAQTPWARLWQVAAHLVRQGFPSQSLKVFLQSPFLRVDHRDLLLQAVRKTAVVQLENLLPFLPDLTDEEREALARFLEALRQDLEALRREDAQPLTRWIHTLQGFFEKWTHGMPPEVEAAFARALQVLAQVAGVLVSPEMTPEEFLNLWQTLLQSTRLPDPERPEPEYPVHVLGMAEAQAFEGDLLYVLEATDEALPGPGPNDFLLPHKFRETLGLPTQDRVAREQEFRFHLLLEAPFRRVVVSYPQVDGAGNPRLPTLLADRVLTGQTPLQSADQVYRQGALAPEEVALRQSKPSPEVVAPHPLRPTRQQVEAWLEQQRREVSVTLLQRLATEQTCRYRVYLEHILQLAPPREPSLFPLVEEGNVIHRLLRVLFEALLQRFGTQLPPEKTFLALYDDAMNQVLHEGFHVPVVRTFLRKRYHRLAPLLYRHLEAEHREGLAPRFLEHRLQKSLPEVDLVLKGRIDRLDVSEDGRVFRVIDYKTGGASRNHKALFWQVWAYTALYQSQVPEAAPVAPQLLLLSQPDLKRMVKTGLKRGETVETRLAEAQEEIQQAVERLLKAEFEPYPGCHRCPFREVCPYASG